MVSSTKFSLPTIYKKVDKEKFLFMRSRKFWKKIVNENRIIWERNLDNALLTYWMSFKTPIRKSPNKIYFGMSYHLPMELENNALRVFKMLNLN